MKKWKFMQEGSIVLRYEKMRIQTKWDRYIFHWKKDKLLQESIIVFEFSDHMRIYPDTKERSICKERVLSVVNRSDRIDESHIREILPFP